MRALGCKDLGTDCPFVASGEADEEVMQKMMVHAMSDHAADIAKMKETMSDEDVAKMMQSKIHDA